VEDAQEVWSTASDYHSELGLMTCLLNKLIFDMNAIKSPLSTATNSGPQD
jgi:hypothetical protein